MKTLYRIENPVTQLGLWYTGYGEFRPMDESRALIPMEYDPEVAGGWYSACENLAQLDDWFTTEERKALAEIGYHTYKFEVRDYKIKHGHAFFRRATTQSMEVFL